jgi:7-methyl-GTP pyrophosphatase
MLLERLEIEFISDSPNINEHQLDNEPIEDYVIRLSEEKARAVAVNHSDAIIIGSDQALESEGNILGKPGTHENAKKQLATMSGKALTFYTGLCVLNTNTNKLEKDLVEYHVSFRDLNEPEIEQYLIKEQPYQCAGSFMSEKLGISLLSKMEGDDPTALIGLPLIRLCEMLRNQGVNIP